MTCRRHRRLLPRRCTSPCACWPTAINRPVGLSSPPALSSARPRPSRAHLWVRHCKGIIGSNQPGYAIEQKKVVDWVRDRDSSAGWGEGPSWSSWEESGSSWGSSSSPPSLWYRKLFLSFALIPLRLHLQRALTQGLLKTAYLREAASRISST